MKQKILVIMLLAAAMFSACRTNNGEIGPLYGEWALRTLTVDGDSADVDCSLYYFRFQNNIVVITKDLGNHNFSNHYGTWEIEGHLMLMNFTHMNADSNMVQFTPPAELLLPGQEVTTLWIDTLTNRQFELSRINYEGQRIVYRLEKLQ